MSEPTELTLRVEITLTPHPEKIDAAKMDALLDGELKGFQEWVAAQNKGKGLGQSPLTGPERYAVKGYLIYAATAREQP